MGRSSALTLAAFVLCAWPLAEALRAAADEESGALDRNEARKLKNPMPYTRASLAQGKSIYIRATCAECHDLDGTARTGSDLAESADLTDPRSWLYGTADGEIFADIRDGTPGQMPGFKNRLQDDRIWHLVNYVRSLGPKSSRPPIVKEPEPEKTVEEETPLDPKKLKNPIAYTRASIAQGKSIYVRATCAECHDLDGTARSGSDLAEAADLTDPRSWKWGTTDGHVFVAIRDGTEGQMAGFGDRLKDDRVWHLVNYVRSIGPKPLRPKLVESAR